MQSAPPPASDSDPIDPDAGKDRDLEAPEGDSEDGRRRRMAPGDRRSMILEQAAEFFASNGPAASTRALARALGITQALLYRYFPSKEALVRAVYHERFAERWDPNWIRYLHAYEKPLQQRLIDFFTIYLERLSAPDYRLWMRAALEGWSFARFYHNDLVEYVLTPIVAELRREAQLASLAVQPVMYGELEIVFNLHGALTFMRIRRDVYGAPVHPDTAAAIELHVGVFLPGALAQITALHKPDAPASMTVPPLML